VNRVTSIKIERRSRKCDAALENEISDFCALPDYWNGAEFVRTECCAVQLPTGPREANMQLTSMLRRAAQINAHGLAIVDGAARTSWSAFVARIARVAGGLVALGLRRGERVAVLAGNHASFLELQYAVVWAGGVIVPVNTRLSVGEIGTIVGAASASMLVADPQFEGAVRKVAQGLPELRNVIWFSGSEAIGLQSYARLAELHAIEDRSEGGMDRPVGIYFTGGTTGRPKGVMLSQANFVCQAAAMQSALELRSNSVYLHATPLFHLADCGIGHAVTFAAGGHSFLARFEAAACLEKICEDHVTEINLVPTMLAALLDAAEDESHGAVAALAAVRTVAYGGAPIPAPLLRQLLARLPNAKFRQFYGMTETCGACTSLAPEWHTPEADATRLRSAGQAMPFAELKIVAPDGSERLRGEAGEVAIRGPQVMLGYWQDPKSTSVAVRDGWMFSGDVGVMDEHGFVSIVERLKDMIISGGENIYSGEIENAIAAHPAVVACAVIGLPDPRWGEKVHAIVVTRPHANNAALQHDLEVHCRGLIAGYKCPKSWDIRATPLPLSSIGKINKAQLREEAFGDAN
jgi:long-chain acyl-CoA synthetase